MNALQRKLLRDLWRLRTQALAIALVIGAGVATFVMSLSVLRSLERARDEYYLEYRFGHLFAQVKRAPGYLRERIAAIPGVLAVETRVVAEVPLDLPNMPEPAAGRIVSLPDYAEPAVNRLLLRRGRFPDVEAGDEVLLNEAFADAHGFSPGSRFLAVLNGRRRELRVSGIALSPEFIYQIRGGDLFPDERHFGVMWMRERHIGAAFDLRDAFNQVCLRLVPGASEPEVTRQLDALLARYGTHGSVGRSQQVSHRYVSDELAQLRAMALIPPVIFLAVAGFILNVVLDRLIATQRQQIATLKAFGYRPAEIGWHFGQFTIGIVVLGLALGVASGGWLGRGLASMYTRFFHFARLDFGLDPGALAGAAVLTIGAAAVAVGGSLRRVVRLTPAQGMHAESPTAFRPSWLETLGLRWLRQTDRMALRQIRRRPVRSLLSTLGIAFGIAVMILGSFGKDVVDNLIAHQFGAVQQFDYSLSLFEPSSASAAHSVRHLPGVLASEPFRSAPIRLRAAERRRTVAVLGLPGDGRLFRLRRTDGAPVELPAEGLLLSAKLAELLGVGVGDELEMEFLEGAQRVCAARVAGTIEDFSGLAVYMNLAALNRLLREGPTVSGAFLRVDPAFSRALYLAVKRLPRAAGLTSQQAMLDSFHETLSENLLRMRLFNIGFASLISFGVVYNLSRITFAERARELATLRVIGLTRGEVSVALIGEIVVLVLAAIPLGLLLGRGLAAIAASALETETQRFAATVAPATYAMAVTTVLAAAAVSCLVVQRRIVALDLCAALKADD